MSDRPRGALDQRLCEPREEGTESGEMLIEPSPSAAADPMAGQGGDRMGRGRKVFWGLVLIVVGGILLAQALGSEIPGFDQIWPAVLVVGGIVGVTSFALGDRRNPGQVFLGLAALLAGVFFLFVTLGPLEYDDLGTWWPVFVLIGSVSWLGQWAATGLRDWGALFLALVALVIGGAGMAVALELLGPETRETLPDLWPVMLIAGGLMVFLRAALGRRS